MGSFATPLSGLTAAQDQLQSVSNNLANLNTDGYKDQDLTFNDVFSQSTATNGSGDPLQTGYGVAVSSTVANFTEGTLNPTGTALNGGLGTDSLSLRVPPASQITRAPATLPRTRQDKSSRQAENYCWAIPGGRNYQHFRRLAAVAGGYRCDDSCCGQHYSWNDRQS